MTYNIRGALGMDGQRSIARIADVVAAQKADMICFQEVHQRLLWSGLSDQPRQLQRHLGFPVTFYSTVNFGLGGFGLGIATRLPIVSVKKRPLLSVREQRGVLEVQFQWNGETRRLFCTHWGLNQEERERQAAQMAEWVRASKTAPTLICGDLNERPDGLAVKTLLNASGLIDAGITGDQATYPSNAPEARIDYVLCSSQLRVITATALPTEASDHLPLIVDFE